MAHLTDSWDGVLFAEANGSTRVSVPRDPQKTNGRLPRHRSGKSGAADVDLDLQGAGDAASIGRFQINHPAAPSKSRIAHLGNADLRSASRLVQVALRRDGWWNAERAWIQEGLPGSSAN